MDERRIQEIHTLLNTGVVGDQFTGEPLDGEVQELQQWWRAIWHAIDHDREQPIWKVVNAGMEDPVQWCEELAGSIIDEYRWRRAEYPRETSPFKEARDKVWERFDDLRNRIIAFRE